MKGLNKNVPRAFLQPQTAADLVSGSIKVIIKAELFVKLKTIEAVCGNSIISIK